VFQEAERGAFAGNGDQRRHEIRAHMGDDLGSLDDGGELIAHWRGLTMLPGGTPASFSAGWNSAASAFRSGPAGPHTTRRSNWSRAWRAAFCQGWSSVIGPSTEKNPRSWSATIRKKDAAAAGAHGGCPHFRNGGGSSAPLFDLPMLGDPPTYA
jgi:hypothetical protein